MWNNNIRMDIMHVMMEKVQLKENTVEFRRRSKYNENISNSLGNL